VHICRGYKGVDMKVTLIDLFIQKLTMSLSFLVWYTKNKDLKVARREDFIQCKLPKVYLEMLYME
jgi:hypothetical protein